MKPPILCPGNKELKSRSNLVLIPLWSCNNLSTWILSPCSTTPPALSRFLVLKPRSSEGWSSDMPLQVYSNRDPGKSPGLLQKLLSKPPGLGAPPGGSWYTWCPLTFLLLRRDYDPTRQKRSESVVGWGGGVVKWFPANWSESSSIQQKSWANTADFCKQ